MMSGDGLNSTVPPSPTKAIFPHLRVARMAVARAAAFAEQPLDRDRYGKPGILLVRVQRGEEPRSARTENQNVSLECFHKKFFNREGREGKTNS